MTTAIWDPNTILQIDEGSGLGLFCVGVEPFHYDNRCRLVIPQNRYNTVLYLLDCISMKLPHEVTISDLRSLARLGLCEYHGYQENEVVAKWENILGCVNGIYRTYKERWETAIRDSNFFAKEVNKCRGLLGVKEHSSQTLSAALRPHINSNAQLKEELVASQAMVKDQKEEICRLSAENSRLATLLKRAEEEQERWKNQEPNLTAECEKLRKQCAELQADINAGNDQYKDLQDREQSATMELMATTTQMHELQAVNLGSENDKKTLQSEIDILKHGMKSLNDNNASVSSQLANTAADLETVTDDLCAVHKENMELRVELTTATTEIMDLRNKIDQLSTTVWYRMIQGIKRKLSGLRHLLKPGKEVSDEEGMALAPAVAARDGGLA